MSKMNEVISTSTSEIKVFYYIDGQDTPYLTKLNVTGSPPIGKVKEEIIDDEEILPFDTQDRIVAYLVSNEGSTISSGGGGLGEKNKHSKHLHHQQDYRILTSTPNSSFNIQQLRLQSEFGARSFSSSNLESTTSLDETENDQYSKITDSTIISSRYHGRNRPRGRQHQLPSGLDQVLFSILSSNFFI
ncbi:unnamed protein product [Rotaria sordida]|uniref:DIX domain-containing protein n=1 Tax=Rotaria sordida TaxID=392033 RepID=A0A815UUX1_9BILA|nr:unnamed protein product [Rotaria sordida]CAF1527785.1 unnamed protein product [Rotaria sordida]